MVLFCGARGLDGLLSFGYFDHCGFALIEGVFFVLLHLCGFCVCTGLEGKRKKQREKHMELAGAQTSKAAESRRAEELERVEARLSRCAHYSCT